MTAATLVATPAPQEDYYSHFRSEVTQLIPSTARSVVDVGCGAGALGRGLKLERPRVQVRGVEIVPAQAERARAFLDDVACGSAEHPLPAHWPAPDCVVFADVLEHLVDPWSVLRAWRARLAPGGAVVVSLPNIAFRGVLRGLARGRWDYAEEGILDRTHLRFFTRLTAFELLSQAGYRVLRAERHVQLRPWMTKAFAWVEQRRVSTEHGLLDLFADLHSFQFLFLAEPLFESDATQP